MYPWIIDSYERYLSEYSRAQATPDEFFGGIAETFTWQQKWESVQEADLRTGEINWFVSGQLNITENCLDRHLETRGEKIALIFEPNNSEDAAKSLTYQQLFDEVCRTANMLRKLGVQKGDRVCVYMPMVPELVFTVLACARLGAIHSVVFAGFSAESLANRINDCGAKLVVTADVAFRGAKHIPLKPLVDEAIDVHQAPSVENVLVLKRSPGSPPLNDTRDRCWATLHEETAGVCPPARMNSEDPLFILYTSGSTGSPKGILHSTAGYMIWAAYTFANVFQVKEESVHWCTADIGWITGHTYLVYGPLLMGCTTVMYEGLPSWPDSSRLWNVVDKHNVTHFYTAPTVIRALQACGDEPVHQSKRSSLQVLGTVGEPINSSAWRWYHDVVGDGRCPVVDTWWQTETGGIMIGPLAGITPTRPTFAGLPLPGVVPVVLDEQGQPCQSPAAEGALCIKAPWPGMLRGVYGNPERFRNGYLRPFPGYYFTGDGCRREVDGYYRITGRIDDVLNVSGHRLGTAEIENALNRHPHVSESAVIGIPDPLKGESILAYVVAKQARATNELITELHAEVTRHIGAIARPQHIVITPDLPKTRSGKIMRRILRKIAHGERRSIGDTSTLTDPGIVERLISDFDAALGHESAARKLPSDPFTDTRA